MGAHHDHGHAKRGSGAAQQKRLLGTLILAALYMVAEWIGGMVSGSLSLLADAGHMLSDVGALGLSLFAIWVAQRPPSAKATYGYYRTEILAALINGALLVGLSIFILVEAVQRLQHPQAVAAPAMLWIAAGGLLINLFGLVLLHGGRDDNLNVRGAFLHVLTDALGSVQVLVAGALIWAYGWSWADPVASILISLLVLYSSWSLLREAVRVLMEGAPSHVDVDEVRTCLATLPGVTGVHDLHVWSITSGMEALSAHLVVGAEPSPGILDRTRKVLHDRFGIHHVTVQLEPEECGDGC
jgi:cobalt-zinc-cadmium efflux system protein